MRKNLLVAALIALLSFGVIFIVTFSADPQYRSMSLDGGAFAYCGWRITLGEVLYRDCWDNKPPAVYYLNAAVIALGGRQPWLLWLAQVAWLSLTLAAFYSLLRAAWGRLAAAASSLLLLFTMLHPTFLAGGNLTETYALLPITLALGAFWGFLQSGRKRYLLALGLCAAAAFLFKPTYAAVGLAAALALAGRELQRGPLPGALRRWLVQAGLLLAGVGLPLLLVAAWWAVQGALPDLIYAVFTHNKLYVQQGFSWRAALGTLRILLLAQPLASLTLLAGASQVTFFGENWRDLAPLPARQPAAAPRQWWMLGVALTILLDVALTALSGKNYYHYFLIPTLSLAAGSPYLFYRLAQAAQNKNAGYALLAAAASGMILLPWLVEVVGKEMPAPRDVIALLANPGLVHYQPDDIETFILEHSTADESILIWDYEPEFYVNTARRSPTRYIFLPHLFTPTPNGPNGFAEFMQELEADPPALIITTPSPRLGLVYLGTPAESLCQYCPADIRQGVLALKAYLSDHYRPYTDIQGFAIYTRLP